MKVTPTRVPRPYRKSTPLPMPNRQPLPKRKYKPNLITMLIILIVWVYITIILAKYLLT